MKQQMMTLLALCLAFAGMRAAVVDTLSIANKYLDTPESVVVITPETGRADARYPTVYLLNGFSGDHKSWIKMRPDLPELADRYGFVIVMPDGRDSWYWDSPVDPKMQMESFFVYDLVPYIDMHYPTFPEASMRAVSGLSMGGHGALWLGMRHSDIWGSAASMSGGVDIRPFPEKWKMKLRLGEKKDNEDVWNSHTVINLVPTLKPGQLNIAFDCGASDFFAAVNDDLHKALLDAGIDHDYTSRPGTHSQAYWRNSLLYHLLFFNEAFKKAGK
ncbi:MAG: alpha/beta hydrolase family protein [Bacteroidales bacterium]|nr:alpha/beta hydrolase family protein [Bacteroidales bacterium]